tara:strand:+ start:238 stop:717 length:480 start_codon:yes stop_codon:yes gene_type:complete
MCHYVDIGCNLGVFAQHAVQLGARVTCIEPQSVYNSVLEGAARRWPHFNYKFAAVSMENYPSKHSRSFVGYRPCRIGANDPGTPAPLYPLSSLLTGRITLLKVDIDSFEGAILSKTLAAIKKKEVEVESILVELGTGKFAHLGMQKKLNPTTLDHKGKK